VAFGVLIGLLLVTAVMAAILLTRSPAKATPPPLPDLRALASPEFPIDQGKALVLVLAMDCGHCIQAAEQVGTFDTEANDLHVFFLLYGRDEEVDLFFAQVGKRFPYRLATDQEYADFGGDDPPAVYLLRDGKTRARWMGYRFNLQVLQTELARE
jgi:hypothetical protein